MHDGENVLCQGYGSPARLVPRVTVTMRDHDSHVSATPAEPESRGTGMRPGGGHVAVVRLGWSAVT